MFEFLDHTADVAVRLKSPGEAALIKDAACALLAILLDEERSGPVELREAVTVSLEAEDPEALLIDFLNELIFLFDTQRLLVAQVDVQEVRLAGPALLRAVLRGETHDPERHSVKTEIKAATFHGLTLLRTCQGIEGDVVFDL